MKVRKDALVGAAHVVSAVNRIGHEHQPFACATVGLINSSPNSRNTIPGKVFFTIDLRHPEHAVLSKMAVGAKAACEEAAAKNGLQLDFKEIWYSPPVKFDTSCVAAVKAGAEELGMPSMPIISGAGHDACYMSRVAPTGMIFIPCEDGISHNEIENATRGDCGAGCDVLLRAVVERANAL
jgi:N-carbamoyl-L-amino-acid hydrolase